MGFLHAGRQQALGLLLGLEELGVAGPDRISVVGCDDIFGTRLSRPALSTVTAPAELVGASATRMLVNRVRAGAPDPATRWCRPR